MKHIVDAAAIDFVHMCDEEATQLFSGGASKRRFGMNLVQPVGGGLRDELVKRRLGPEIVKGEAVSDAGFARNIVGRNLAKRPFGKQLRGRFYDTFARRQIAASFLSRECHSTSAFAVSHISMASRPQVNTPCN